MKGEQSPQRGTEARSFSARLTTTDGRLAVYHRDLRGKGHIVVLGKKPEASRTMQQSPKKAIS